MATIIVQYDKTSFYTTKTSEASELLSKSGYGSLAGESIYYADYEVLYLYDKKKLIVQNASGKLLTREQLVHLLKKQNPEFLVKYAVYADMRNRGYIVKTALKYGAEFRVYDRGIKPGEDHAKWVLYPIPEKKTYRWHDFTAKNRVAHSTKKRLLVGIVDDERAVTYYEVRWVKP